METLVVGYLVAWAATTLYLGWLAAQNTKLARRQQELTALLNERDPTAKSYSTAA